MITYLNTAYLLPVNIGMMSLRKKRKMNEVDMQQQKVSCIKKSQWKFFLFSWCMILGCVHLHRMKLLHCHFTHMRFGFCVIGDLICCPYSLCDLFFFSFIVLGWFFYLYIPFQQKMESCMIIHCNFIIFCTDTCISKKYLENKHIVHGWQKPTSSQLGKHTARSKLLLFNHSMVMYLLLQSQPFSKITERFALCSLFINLAWIESVLHFNMHAWWGMPVFKKLYVWDQ